MTTIIGLGTYRMGTSHGGGRRVRALRDLYAAAGVRYLHVAAERGGMKGPRIDEDDRVLDLPGPPLPYEWLFGDMIAGAQAAREDRPYRAARDLVARIKPRAVQLEQPFLYPLFHRLRAEGYLTGAKLIYSAHNHEGPHRHDLVKAFRLNDPSVRQWEHWVRELERRCLEEADLILAVSKEEASIFAQASHAQIIVAPNGIAHKTHDPERVRAWRARMPGPFATIVGSGHAPNIHGFIELLVETGMPFIPPRPAMVVCGTMARHLMDDPRARAHGAALANRALLVPEIDDDELAAALEAAAFVAVPITYGAGTNLKTAEALASMKPVLTTPRGARGFERFIGTPGFLVASDRPAFRRGFAELLRAPALALNVVDRARRESVHWAYGLNGVWAAVEQILAAP